MLNSEPETNLSMILEKMQSHPLNIDRAGKSPWESFIFKRIVQLSGDICLLDDKQSAASIPMIFRAIFEAQVDLFLILEDKNYCKLLDYQELKQKLKIQTDADLLAYGIEKVQGSQLKKDKIRVRDLEENDPEYVKGFNFQRKLEIAFDGAEETWEELYVIYRVMANYVHGMAYNQKELIKMNKKCMGFLVVLLESTLERVTPE
ncbi:MAG TPA: hypothetical protein DD412_03985 [Holosporales bacterium]|nr:hypothetical protein [Holosporales bacterium]